MARLVALLRGINVGGRHSLAMADVRAVFAAADATDVTTYIQSGNVVFTHGARSLPQLAARLEADLAATAGFAVPVVLRTRAELAALIAGNPFAGEPEDDLHVSLLATAPPADALAAVDAAAFLPERCALVGRDLYLCLPRGLGRSKLAVTLARQRALAAATTRNWRTIEKLHALAAE